LLGNGQTNTFLTTEDASQKLRKTRIRDNMFFFLIASIGVLTSSRRCKEEFQVVTEEPFQECTQSVLVEFSITVLVVSVAVITSMLPLRNPRYKQGI
jgi:hypothetical protein